MGVAENQFLVFTQMSTRGYYEPKPANKTMIDEATSAFKIFVIQSASSTSVRVLEYALAFLQISPSAVNASEIS